MTMLSSNASSREACPRRPPRSGTLSCVLTVVVAFLALVVVAVHAHPSGGSARQGTAGIMLFRSDSSPLSSSSLLPRGLNEGSGDATYYNVGLGACEVTNTDRDLIAALNWKDFGAYWPAKKSPACGSCLLVSVPSKPDIAPLKIQVQDKCPGCKAGDLDLSPAAFTHFYPEGQGRFPITWTRVSCDGFSPLAPVEDDTDKDATNAVIANTAPSGHRVALADTHLLRWSPASKSTATAAGAAAAQASAVAAAAAAAAAASAPGAATAASAAQSVSGDGAVPASLLDSPSAVAAPLISYPGFY
ncbi:hypothetical protein AMAG_15639 [Allomyces macrogynus ATCC 38327]|uniref:RlpA-like protein double-psi beta-barrel domain-containing protein n=1 Tax=Allomyces macrogynus (strain ATCC 38327) TaxID=578462 RepID=A0A0L0TA17_ALLM3|nr:hypothetical protein AMAG_15639 [Allomyces macrogynus ATCC 38327]|eukprot:KNE71404.1 hypothetical protein AMAG_15639 [Allomyces macrogynus ATCC 38327]